MTTAFIFPGQGGQFIGQGRAWVDQHPELMDLFQMADDLSGRPITKLCFEGPAEELSQTINLQPAVLAVSLAALRLLLQQGHQPNFTAGHSLGEFGALVAAKVFDETTALQLVTKRAQFMAESAVANPGAMAAVIGLPTQELESICELARNEGLVIMANFNTPEQTVISGTAKAVAAAGKYVKMKSGRLIPLPVSGGFHTQLMAEAGEKFAQLLAPISFNQPICPVVPNSSGQPTTDPVEIKARLSEQITSPVLWTKTVNGLLEAGTTEFVEAWPKAYLGSLVKKCLPTGSSAVINFTK